MKVIQEILLDVMRGNASPTPRHGSIPFAPKGLRKRKRGSRPGKVYPNAVAMSMAPDRLARRRARQGLT